MRGRVVESVGGFVMVLSWALVEIRPARGRQGQLASIEHHPPAPSSLPSRRSPSLPCTNAVQTPSACSESTYRSLNYCARSTREHWQQDPPRRRYRSCVPFQIAEVSPAVGLPVRTHEASLGLTLSLPRSQAESEEDEPRRRLEFESSSLSSPFSSYLTPPTPASPPPPRPPTFLHQKLPRLARPM